MKRFWIIMGCVLLILSGLESFAANTMTDLTKSLVRYLARFRIVPTCKVFIFRFGYGERADCLSCRNENRFRFSRFFVG